MMLHHNNSYKNITAESFKSVNNYIFVQRLTDLFSRKHRTHPKLNNANYVV